MGVKPRFRQQAAFGYPPRPVRLGAQPPHHRRRLGGGVFAVDLHLVLDKYDLERATILGQRSWESFGWLSGEDFRLTMASME
jgi:hypothetical protein